MTSPIRLHWTKVVIGLCVLAAITMPAHEAQAHRRKRVEIPECAKADLYRARKMHKEEKDWAPRCTAALKAEATKPDTPPPAKASAREGKSRQASRPSAFDTARQLLVQQRDQQQRARQMREADQRARQHQAQQLQAQRRAQQQAWEQQRALQQQQAGQLAQQRAEQQRQAELLAAQQRAWQQQLALQQQQAALPRAPLQPPAPAPAPAAPPSGQAGTCFAAVQDKVAWDREGKLTRWSPANIAKLCAGAEDSVTPVLCFSEAMRRDKNREWPEAIELCAGKR